MQRDLTQGPVARSMLLFAVPMILGNLLQQFYNVADTLIVGRFLGADALAAVGASYALMSFLTSILLGLSMGSGVVFAQLYGARREEDLKTGLFTAFVLIGSLAVMMNIAVFLFLDQILAAQRIPPEVLGMTREYLSMVFWGILPTFLYNFFASVLRAVGNSSVPLYCLAVASVLNVGLDLLFVLGFHWGVAGAAAATVIAQGVSAAAIMGYGLFKVPLLRLARRHLRFDGALTKELSFYSLLTCAQQSIMNFGILLVQGLVNSFGPAVMAAFAAGVKIDSFAYMPVQDFGNAFSTFLAQNYGAKRFDRVRQGVRAAVWVAVLFCAAISVLVCLFAKELLLIFVQPGETEVLRIGAQYLRVEGACYIGIGCLFLLYGLYRGLGKPGMSVVLTVVSLGTRVALAYVLAPIPAVGLLGVWWAVPIGWLLADILGLLYYFPFAKKQLKAHAP